MLVSALNELAVIAKSDKVAVIHKYDYEKTSCPQYVIDILGLQKKRSKILVLLCEDEVFEITLE